MNQHDIRRTFLSFFQKKEHHHVLSAPLIPARDPTILFTNAGMNQFKKVFLKEESREYSRAVSIQKCMRASGKHNDFSEVGKTDFHHTFFEMLGNFSFGDYFKEKAIEYAWDLLTNHFQLQAERLWITVFRDDEEAYRIWEKKIGVPSKKIIRLDEKDNFWQMGETGPCGPCSEVHYDRGQAFGPDTFGDENRRYVEIWNLVFMQYNRDESGKMNPLPKPSIDTGMGLERLAAVLQGVPSNYQTDLFQPLLSAIAERAGVDPADPRYQIDCHVIADHIRALTFLIADGVVPANDGRGYVLRRILRRAAKHGKSIGFSKPFLYELHHCVTDIMKNIYPELEYNKNYISEVLLSEEERFNRTLLNGLKRFEDLVEKTLSQNQKMVSGAEVFKLSDTYGFPLDFAVDLAMEKNLAVNLEEYQAELEHQRSQSRQDLSDKQKRKVKRWEELNELETIFTGYDSLAEEVTLVKMFHQDREVTRAQSGMDLLLVFDRTPFYAESGGQAGDRGEGKNEDVFVEIHHTHKVSSAKGQVYLHEAKLIQGELRQNSDLRISVDSETRSKIAAHHSATHLLQAALREVLGLHIKQSGSFVGPDKLRFDFTHFKALTDDEIDKVERMVNRKIRENLSVSARIMKYEEAISKGAIAIFEEKYGDVVRSISMGDFSHELCGGTHVSSTGDIGCFKILAESSISSGIRRLEALAGAPAFDYLQMSMRSFNEILGTFQQKQDQIAGFLKNLQNEIRDKDRQIRQLQNTPHKEDFLALIQKSVTVNNCKMLVTAIEVNDHKQLRGIADEINQQLQGVTVIFSNILDKSSLVMTVHPQAPVKLHAGKVVKEISNRIKGSGGGRPDFAQGGGEPVQDPRLFESEVLEIIKRFLE